MDKTRKQINASEIDFNKLNYRPTIDGQVMGFLDIFFFFFSSRRRHTRFDCDWSSDVCSSDLRLCNRMTNPSYWSSIWTYNPRSSSFVLDQGRLFSRFSSFAPVPRPPDKRRRSR